MENIVILKRGEHLRDGVPVLGRRRVGPHGAGGDTAALRS